MPRRPSSPHPPALPPPTPAQILGLLLLNAGISFYEESSADAAIKALAGALAPKAKALRGGAPTALDAADVVPGARARAALARARSAPGKRARKPHHTGLPSPATRL